MKTKNEATKKYAKHIGEDYSHLVAANKTGPDYGLRYDWVVVETARDEYGVADRKGSIFVGSLDLETATLIAAAPSLLLSMRRMEAMSQFVGSEAMRGEASAAILRATEGK